MSSIDPTRLARWGAAALAAGLVLASPALSTSSAWGAEPGAAPAATNQAPTPVDDRVSIRGFDATVVDVLANDSDPDGDDLRLCRVSVDGTPLYAEIVSDDDFFFSFRAREAGRGEVQRGGPTVRVPPSDHQRLIIVDSENRGGTYSVRYGVCDRDEVRFAEVTVRVRAVPELRARSIPGRPGVVQFTNPSDKKYVVDYFTAGQSDFEPTTVRVLAHDRVRIRTTSHRVDYFAYQPRGGAFVSGSVTRIQRATARPTSTPSSREARR